MEERRAEYAAKLEALRSAEKQGIDSIEAGDYQTFDSADALADDFRKEAERIIAEMESERKIKV